MSFTSALQGSFLFRKVTDLHLKSRTYHVRLFHFSAESNLAKAEVRVAGTAHRWWTSVTTLLNLTGLKFKDNPRSLSMHKSEHHIHNNAM